MTQNNAFCTIVNTQDQNQHPVTYLLNAMFLHRKEWKSTNNFVFLRYTLKFEFTNRKSIFRLKIDDPESDKTSRNQSLNSISPRREKNGAKSSLFSNGRPRRSPGPRVDRSDRISRVANCCSEFLNCIVHISRQVHFKLKKEKV